jgi:hypothetical protein
MTPKKLTVDDVRHHAEEVRDIAKRDAQRVKTQVLDEQLTQTLIITGVAVLTLVSVAYFMGSRRGARGVVCEKVVGRVICDE